MTKKYEYEAAAEREEHEETYEEAKAGYESGEATAEEYVESVGARLRRRAEEMSGTPLCGSAAKAWREEVREELRALAATLEA